MIPLPEPVDDVWVMWRGERELLRAEDNYHTAEAMRAYGDARAAEERERAADRLLAAAQKLAPVGRRVNQVDLHVSNVLLDHAAAIRKGE